MTNELQLCRIQAGESRTDRQTDSCTAIFGLATQTYYTVTCYDFLSLSVYSVMTLCCELVLFFSLVALCRKFHEPLPIMPLKLLAHNELVGRVIGESV